MQEVYCSAGMIQISIIIPTLNEAETLPKTLQSIVGERQVEIIVVDASSQDKTWEIASVFGVKIIHSPQKNRAHQMNLGAAAAAGKIFLFLHADTLLPTGYLPLVSQVLAMPQTVAGAFELGIDGAQKSFQLLETAVNWRSRFFSLPYGDQALFMKAEIFRQIGGFAKLPIMEDFDLVQRLKRRGKIGIAPAKVLTSNRRWQKLGICRTTAINQLIILGYYLGISPAELARWYGRK
jgi:rSAM/selenodomain-associated transferase 2